MINSTHSLPDRSPHTKLGSETGQKRGRLAIGLTCVDGASGCSGDSGLNNDGDTDVGRERGIEFAVPATQADKTTGDLLIPGTENKG